MQMEKKGIATNRGNLNREIRKKIEYYKKSREEQKENPFLLSSSTHPSKSQNLIELLSKLIKENTDSIDPILENYIESYQLLKEKNITSLYELKDNITDLRDKNYKTIRALKDTEKKIEDKTKLIDQAEKYLKYKGTYKAYTKLKKNKQGDFYNEYTAEIILFESTKKYLKEHLGERKTLNLPKWKSKVNTLKKKKTTKILKYWR